MLVFTICACTSGVLVEVRFTFLLFVSANFAVSENLVSTRGNYWVSITLLGHSEHKLEASACTVIMSWTAAPSMRRPGRRAHLPNPSKLNKNIT